jgi:hypothetical protein
LKFGFAVALVVVSGSGKSVAVLLSVGRVDVVHRTQFNALIYTSVKLFVML